MKLETELLNLRYDFIRKGTVLEFFVPEDISSSLEKYLGSQVNLELKKAKRSNEANGYLWVLIGELQQKLKIPKEEIYTQYVRDCGVYDVYCMQDKAVDKFIECWHEQGLGWVCETMPSKVEGCTNIFAYRGTSDYDKEQMSTLLSQVVQDCIDQGIPTKPKDEIDALLKEFN